MKLPPEFFRYVLLGMTLVGLKMDRPLPRRLRFGLRSLFVLVTVICIWLGYQANWIRQRHAILRSQAFVPASTLAFPDPAVRAPAGLWLLGEKGIRQLLIGEKDVDQARRLFPEAEVMQWENPFPFNLDP